MLHYLLFAIATVTLCNKCFSNYSIFEPSEALMKTHFLPVGTRWEIAGHKLLFVCHFRNFGFSRFNGNDEIEIM